MRNLLRAIWYSFCKNYLIFMPDSLFYNLIGFITHLRFRKKYTWMNLKNPMTFNEKINYLKIKRPDINAAMWADKVAVREYVSEKIGDKYLIPIHGVYLDANDINFQSLPNGFALKTNHGSGWNIICKDKTQLDVPKTVSKLNRWLRYNAYYLSREWQYKDIKPQIICEQLLEYDIFDYKFFCFNGNPEIIQVDIDRFSNHTRAFFNEKWERLDFSILYPQTRKHISKPEQLGEMLQVAKVLSEKHSFLRIDLYVYDEKVYFGEITLHPEGGFGAFIPAEYNRILGDKIILESNL